MTGIVTAGGIIALAVIMAEIYSETRRPVLYAIINTLAGCAVLMAAKMYMTGAQTVELPAAAISAVLGVPGAVLCTILSVI